MERNIFTYEAINSALVIHLPKEVDHHNCLTLKYETDLLLAENYINRIIFDFSGTEFMDSSGIGVILNRYKQMEGSSGFNFFISCVQRSWTTLAGESPVTVIASEPCS